MSDPAMGVPHAVVHHRTMATHAQVASTIHYLRSAHAPHHRAPIQDGAACAHCHGSRVQKWGGFSGRQRYRCRDCGRTFSTFTGTALHHLKRAELWRRFLGCIDGRLTVRSSAEVLDIDKDTALRWRHRLLDQWRREPKPRLKHRLVIGDFCLPHSDKGGRYLQRPPRRRGEPWGFPSFQTGPVTVLVALERRTHASGSTAMIIESVGVRRFIPEDYDSRITHRVREITEIVGCGGPCCALAGFAGRLGASYRSERRSFFPREVFLIRREVRSWLRPFRGVATRRLDNYLEWFRRRGGWSGLRPTNNSRRQSPRGLVTRAGAALTSQNSGRVAEPGRRAIPPPSPPARRPREPVWPRPPAAPPPG